MTTLIEAPADEERRRYPLADARKLADRLVEALGDACERIEVGGSVRRSRPYVKDVELVCIPRPIDSRVLVEGEATAKDLRRFWYDALDLRVYNELVPQGVLDFRPNQRGRTTYGPLNRFLVDPHTGLGVDIFCTTPDLWGLTLFLRTGPAEWNRRVMGRLKSLGMRGHVTRAIEDPTGAPLPCPEEEALFDLLRWPVTPPHLRLG